MTELRKYQEIRLYKPQKIRLFLTQMKMRKWEREEVSTQPHFCSSITKSPPQKRWLCKRNGDVSVCLSPEMRAAAGARAGHTDHGFSRSRRKHKFHEGWSFSREVNIWDRAGAYTWRPRTRATLISGYESRQTAVLTDSSWVEWSCQTNDKHSWETGWRNNSGIIPLTGILETRLAVETAL